MGGAGEGCSGQRSGSGGHSRTCAAMEGKRNFPRFSLQPQGSGENPKEIHMLGKITEI